MWRRILISERNITPVKSSVSILTENILLREYKMNYCHVLSRSTDFLLWNTEKGRYFYKCSCCSFPYCENSKNGIKHHKSRLNLIKIKIITDYFCPLELSDAVAHQFTTASVATTLISIWFGTNLLQKWQHSGNIMFYEGE